MMSSIRRFFDRLKICFSYFKLSKKLYDFDYSSLLEVEQHQIRRISKSIERYQHHVNYKHDIYWMNIAVKLLDIVLEKDDWWTIISPSNIEMLNGNMLNNDYMDNSVFLFDKYVNIRNSSRFISLEMKDYLIPDLRRMKAWNLYCQIRKEYTFNWWD